MISLHKQSKNRHSYLDFSKFIQNKSTNDRKRKINTLSSSLIYFSPCSKLRSTPNITVVVGYSANYSDSENKDADQELANYWNNNSENIIDKQNKNINNVVATAPSSPSKATTEESDPKKFSNETQHGQ